MTRRTASNVVPFQRPAPASGQGSRAFVALLVALPLAVFTAVFLWDGTPQSAAIAMPDSERAAFELCDGPVRVNCIVDGDTFWYQGEKIRIADINTPEVSNPGCDEEADLGFAATQRLHALLNAGAFSLEPAPDSPDRDRYGRLLRVVKREGKSVGDVLVSDGLAEEWQGYRREWC